VVYNHLGPDGNYLGEFGDYFTDHYRTPWGEAMNFDGRGSDEVRRFFIENALYWIGEYHIDALRLDAVHAIYDFSARTFLAELAEAVRTEGLRLNRRVFTIAESDLNDSRLLRSEERGGMALDAQWSDDFHHALHRSLTGEHAGYYEDFRGFDDLVKVYRDGFVVDGRYSEFRGRRHGNSAREIDPSRLVVCAQNHDQIGNRALGERLSELVDFEALKLAAGLVLLSPYVPLLFMGEEYGEPSRFQYFVSHRDEELIEAVRRGRREEFSAFDWREEIPDPQDEMTFQTSKLRHELRQQGQHQLLRNFYRKLMELRKTVACLALPNREQSRVLVLEQGRAFGVRRWSFDRDVVVLFHLGKEPRESSMPLESGTWTTLLDSSEQQWGGPGSSLEPEFASDGNVELSLAADSVVVLSRKHVPGRRV
jgi:maltooligosyltrehalose trehalohydrolase